MIARLKPESPLVTVVSPSLGHLRSLYEPRLSDVEAIIIHTTGSGPRERFNASERAGVHRWKSPFHTALWIYGTLLKYGPHYVVGQEPRQIAQLCPEAFCAWHVGALGGHVYDKPGWGNAKTAWWPQRWPSFESPRDLADGRLWLPYAKKPRILTALRTWRNGSVNANTIGVEVEPGEGREWTSDGWANVASVVCDIAARNKLPLARVRILTHSDAHPIKRSTPRGEPWDTAYTQWSWETFVRFAGIKEAI